MRPLQLTLRRLLISPLAVLSILLAGAGQAQQTVFFPNPDFDEAVLTFSPLLTSRVSFNEGAYLHSHEFPLVTGFVLVRDFATYTWHVAGAIPGALNPGTLLGTFEFSARVVDGLRLTVSAEQFQAYHQVISATFQLGDVAPIPEPETYAMLLAGLGLLGWHARRGKLKRAA